MINKFFSIFVILSFLLFNISTTFAEAGTVLPTGNQAETGNVGETGNTTQTNQTTGADSTNVNNSETTDQTDVTVDSTQEVNNDVNTELNTGDNTATENTSAGNLDTGAIQGSTTIINTTGSNLDPGSSIGVQDINPNSTNLISLDNIANRNSLTGPDSLNSNNFSNNTSLFIVDDEKSLLDNEIVIDANTGGNNVLYNTEFGDLTTGDIDLGLNLLNLSNLGTLPLLLALDVWNIYGDYNGDFLVQNALTGPDSINTNTIDNNTDVELDINQDSTFNNLLDINATTGKNEIADNTVVGDLSTGEINIVGAIKNIANVALTPVFYIFNVFGSWDGSLLGGLNPAQFLINEVTGPGSVNENSVSNSNTLDADITNSSEINNDITINANTGKNEVSDNTIVGDITTGSINISANILNVLNSFGAQVGNFTLKVINIFGDWNGDVTPTAQVANEVVEEEIATVSTTLEANEISPAEQEMPVEELQTSEIQKPNGFGGSTELAQEEPKIAGEITSDSQPIPQTGAEKASLVKYLPYLLVSFILLWLIVELATLNRKRLATSSLNPLKKYKNML